MNFNPLIIPLLAQILLTFVLLFRMGSMRLKALRLGKVKMKDIALGQNAWPEAETKASNSYHNQFELPVLFYSALLFAILYQINSTVFLALAYLFSISRILHAFVHSTSNIVRLRFLLFIVGAFSLLAMWLFLAFAAAKF
jgi:hypothetical protein